MQYNNYEPIYLQIILDFKKKIISGEYQAGDKILPVRECAIAYEVNPNTMQKALSVLEQEQLVFSKRTAGRFISEDTKRLQMLKEEMVQTHVKKFLNEMAGYGLNNETIVELIRKEIQHEHNEN